MMLLAILMASTHPSPIAAHPRWLVGDWCFPPGRPLRLRPTDERGDGEEVTTYTADGRWGGAGEAGRWWVKGDRLFERRDRADWWALGKGEKVKIVRVIRFVRHGPDALELRGDGTGWMVRCP